MHARGDQGSICYQPGRLGRTSERRPCEMPLSTRQSWHCTTRQSRMCNMMGGHLGYMAGRRGDVNGTNFRHRCRTLVGVWSTVHLITTYCQELNYSGATPDSFPALLRPTFPHYSGVHSRTTPVYTPVLLRCTLLCYSSPPLDWTGLHLTCLSTGLAPDLTWEVAVIHLSLMYLFLIIYTY